MPALGLLLLGAADPGSEAVVALVLAGVLGLVAWRAPGDVGVVRLVSATLPWAAVLTLGWVSVPREVLEVVAPGVAAARPSASAWTLALRPERVAEGLGTLVLVLGVAAAVLAVRPRRAAWHRALAAATGVWLLLGYGHALAGASSLLGVLPARAGVGAFWAPLVNPNHWASVAVAGLPFLHAAGREAVAERSWGRLAVVLLAGLGVLAAPVATASAGAALALAVVAVGLAAVHRPAGLGRWGVVLGGALLALVAGAGAIRTVLSVQPEWWRLSVVPRLTQYGDTLRVLADHWLVGVGADNYGAAYPPYRTVAAFASFDHVHADPLEQLVTGGVLGALALGLVAWRLPRGAGADRGPAGLALLGLAAHACVDFPWQIPGVAMLAALLWGLWAHDAQRSVGGRRALAGLALASLLAAGLFGARARVETALAPAQAGDAEALAWLEAAAPWRPEPALAALRADPTPARARSVARRFEDDGITLARVARVMLEAGEAGAARPILDRALQRDPNDPRAWQLAAMMRTEEGARRGAAEAWAEALRRWPHDFGDLDATWRAAWATFPVGPWWLDTLADAPAHWSARLAWTALDRGDPSLALLACEQAGRRRPAVHGFMPACASALAQLEGRDAGVAYLRRWLVREPEAYWAHHTLATLGPGGPDDAGFAWAAVRAWALRPEGRTTGALLRDLGRTHCGDDVTAGAEPLCALVALQAPCTPSCEVARRRLVGDPVWEAAWTASLPTCAALPSCEP